MKNVANHKLLEKDIKKTNAFLRSILESSSTISIISTDKNHNITYWNKGAEKIFGYKASQILGTIIDKLYSSDPETQAKVSRMRQEILHKKERTYTIQQIKKNGKKLWIELCISPRLDEKGKLIGILGIGKDITEKVTSEKEKAVLFSQLQQSQKMEALGTLAGGIVHDFSNIITEILGFGQVILNDLPKTDENYQDINGLLASARNASLLVRQLLTFCRKQEIKPQLMELNTFIMSMKQMLEHIMGSDAELVIDLDQKLPKIMFDEGQLVQVMMNLTINARDSMQKDGKLMIKTETAAFKKVQSSEFPEARPGSYVLLSFEDTGCGMNSELMEHIFEPFYTTKETGEGTGLGLSVVYGIVKQNSGWIQVSSKPGKGSKFSIYIPAKKS